jgi:hypothetical protein
MENMDLALSFNNLGVLNHLLGNLEEAKKYNEDALSIKLKIAS